MAEQVDISIKRQRLRQVYEYLRNLDSLINPVLMEVKDQRSPLFVKDLPEHPTVQKWPFGDDSFPFDDEEESPSNTVLRVVRAQQTPCPPPPKILDDWLKSSWKDCFADAQVVESRNHRVGRETQIEKFDDVPDRVLSFKVWTQKRSEWAKNEKPARLSLQYFEKLYEVHGILEREGENFELVIGDGMFELGVVHHPLIIKKVNLKFFHRSDPPEFRIVLSEAESELYLSLFHQIEGLDSTKLGKCKEEFSALEISPVDGEETDAYLQGFVQRIFPNGCFSREKGGTSPNPVIYRDPIFYLRPRLHGYTNFVTQILEAIPTQETFADSLVRIVNCSDAKPASAFRVDGDKRSANEDPDILLTKHANQEQLLIAKKLQRSGSVLVQGPPGTGKTHTIANLVGHLLAEGKRILITSHTNKALRVLRDKVVPPLQPLCVSVLDNDSSSNKELRTAVEHIQKRLSKDDPDELDSKAQQILTERKALIGRLEVVREKILQTRWNEAADVCFGGKAIRPSEAAKFVQQGEGRHSWIPSPVTLGVELPLSETELQTLYRLVAGVPFGDVQQTALMLPDIEETISPEDFSDLLRLRDEAKKRDTISGERFWSAISDHSAEASDRLEKLMNHLQAMVSELADLPHWKLAAIQSGRDADATLGTWQKFLSGIQSERETITRCRTDLLEHTVEFRSVEVSDRTMQICDQIVSHLNGGNRISLFTRLVKREWVPLLDGLIVNDAKPSEAHHFKAARAYAQASAAQKRLARLWDNVMRPFGLPSAKELAHNLEEQCKAFSAPLQECLNWYHKKWRPQLEALRAEGFAWEEYLNTIPPEFSEHSEIKRLVKAVTGKLVDFIEARKNLIASLRLENRLRETASRLKQSDKEREADVVRALRNAVNSCDPTNYGIAYSELMRLQEQRKVQAVITSKLEELAKCAPAWAEALAQRNPLHSKRELPGDPDEAWKWRQLHDELEKRSLISLVDLSADAEDLRGRIHDLTAEAVEAKAWAAQIRRTTPTQRQALGGYVKLRERLTKSGTGKRDAQIMQAAREEMVRARTAVPVWIMPLSSLYSTFKPTEPFDVIIIDEASQSDIQALAALYLGTQAIVVGDDKQVTPSAVGQELEAVQQLIDTTLLSIPARNLYDRKTSIYDLCNISFDGLVQLTEHFRCVPEIIQFSNLIAYDNPIRPLRETSRVRMKPPFVLHRTNGVASDKYNVTEAEEIASLIMAACEHPDYQQNDQGEPVSIGVISLVGETQALEIDKILRKKLSPTEYQKRRILCGNPAHFQGDERDLMFLSMVDSATGDGLLVRRTDGADGMFRKRYNVAVSRARDQVWIVHSLDPDRNLQPNDLRFRLLDYARNPEKHKQSFETQAPKTESPFEREVLRHLLNQGYRVQPQFNVGSYRIDFVVQYKEIRVALECDGDRFHSIENLREDMERQFILERLGWRFVRIRGSKFYRDSGRAMQDVYRLLESFGILPWPAEPESVATTGQIAEAVQQIKRHASRLRESWKGSDGLQSKEPSQRKPNDTGKFKKATSPSNSTISGESNGHLSRELAELLQRIKAQPGAITRAQIECVLSAFIPSKGRVSKRHLIESTARELNFTTNGEHRRIEAALESLETGREYKSSVDAIWRDDV